jgi:flagellin-like hook-associated protein FlgL
MGRKGSVLFVLLSGLLFCTVISSVWANSDSLNYLNNILKGTEYKIDKNMKRLSGGIRLLTDDPANYAIYQRLEAHIRGLNKEVEVGSQLIAYYNYIDALLGTITDSLQRIRELLVQRGNLMYGPQERGFIDDEIASHYAHIRYMLKTSQFNRKKIFESLLQDKLFTDRFKQEAYYRLDNVDTMLSTIIGLRAVYGAKINQLEEKRKAQMKESENAQSFQSTLMDVDYAREISLLKRNQLLFLINILLLGRNK